MPTFDERWAPLSDMLPDVGEPLLPSGGVFSYGTGFDPVTNVAKGLGRDIPRAAKWLYQHAPRSPQEAWDDAKAIAKAIGQSVAHDVAVPGALAKPNPHPPGSELWYQYEDWRNKAAIEWAPMMALNTLGAGLPFAKKGAAGMFGGDLAQTADQIAFAEAKRMQAAGASPAEIRAATGLELFPDKKLRFEIDDSAAKLTPRGEAAVASEWGGVGTMADYFEHPELYRAYPQFRDVPVSIEPPAQRGVQGSFFHGGQPPGDISAADITVSTGAKDPRSVFLHEGSHLIQHLQDFAPGSTTSMASLRPGTASWDLYQQIRANLTRPTPIEQMPPGVLSDTYTYADYVREYKAAMASPEKRAQLDRMAQEAAVREAYRRSAGENEANAVVKRRDYAPEQRRLVPADASFAVPPDRQIVDTRRMLRPQQSELRQMADDAAAKRYLRIGDWHPSETSRNYARGETEPGVSVYDLDAHGRPVLSTLEGDWVEADLRARLRGDEPRHIVTGDHVGTGGDGEPLLKNLKRQGEWVEPEGGVIFGANRTDERTAAAALAARTAAEDAKPTSRVDPRLWSPLSDLKLRKPLDEMEHGYTDIRTPETRIIDPASLVGQYGYFTPSDLSATGRTLTAVDSTRLERPVRAHGGVGFQEETGMGWASEPGIAAKMNNQLAEIAEKTGKPVNIIPMTMKGSAIDASHHVAEPLSQLLQHAPITTANAEAFDQFMRATRPDWVGIQRPEFPDYIRNMQGGMKTKRAMAQEMEKARWQAKGFPNVTAVRHAMSDPSLIDLPRNTSGMSIARYEPGRGLLDTSHPSYRKGIAATWLGRWPGPVPYDIAAPDIARGLAEANARNLAMGKKVKIEPRYHMEKQTAGVPLVQEFTQEWLDNLMKFYERQRRG